MKNVLKSAFIQTIPVMLGYGFVGIAYGLLLQRAGYNFLWAILISVSVYAGTMQFVLVALLSGGVFSLAQIIITTLAVNCRHSFYGLSFIDEFEAMGKRKWYMIFSLTDETYSLLCLNKDKNTKNNKEINFMIAFLNQIYWIIGSVIGSLLGEWISFNTKGIDYAMTALFIVIFVEQWIESKSHLPAFIGFTCAIISLLIFGPQYFILPALCAAVMLLLVLKNRLNSDDEKGEVC